MAEMETPAEQRLRDLPDAPGVYLFRDRAGRVIYIGKAKSLRSRVRSYFQAAPAEAPKTDALVAEIHDLETIVTAGEVEALVLENNLVKRERPRYNIRLRDDKNFPYLKLTLGERYPRLVLVRRARLDGHAYFGPYLPASAARRTIQMVARAFKVATCHEHLDGSRPRPCLMYQLNQCLGPCAGLVGDDEYARAAADARLFLEGRSRDLVHSLEEKMGAAAREERYEAAAHYRDLIRSIEKRLERQGAASVGLEDQDYVAFAREAGIASVQVFQMRGGQVQARRELSFEGIREPDPEFLAAALQSYYASADFVPGTINVPLEPAGGAVLEEWLSVRRGAGRARLVVPRRGPRRQFLETVAKNARLTFEAMFRAPHTHGVEILEALQEALGLDEPPHRIECFDISHIQGSDQAASLVVWEAGRPRPSDYRRFKVKTVAGADDFAAMAEVVGRRYARLLREGRTLPDLVLIDGGVGQLSSATAVLERLGLGHLQAAAIAKREEEIVLDGRPGSLRLPADSPVLHLVQRIRDEAHRFAIAYHRRLRSRRAVASELLEIEGVGPRRARLLLRRFGSVQGVREAPEERLAEAVGEALAERIRLHLGAAPVPAATRPSS